MSKTNTSTIYDKHPFCTKCNPNLDKTGYGTLNTQYDIDLSSTLFRVCYDTVCRNCLYKHMMCCEQCKSKVPLSSIRYFVKKWICLDCLPRWFNKTLKYNYKELDELSPYERNILQYKQPEVKSSIDLAKQIIDNQSLNKKLMDENQSLKKQIDCHISAEKTALNRLDVSIKKQDQLKNKLSHCKKRLDEQIDINQCLNKLLIEYANSTGQKPILDGETKQKLQVLIQICSASIANINDLIEK